MSYMCPGVNSGVCVDVLHADHLLNSGVHSLYHFLSLLCMASCIEMLTALAS